MNETTGISADAPIIPNEGLGGVALRTPIADLQEFLDATHVRHHGKNSWLKLTRPFEARYRLGYVELSVDVRNGKVFKLSAYKGYRGVLLNGITIGMKVKQAMKLEPRLYYDETEELLHCEGVPGVSLDVPAIDPDPAAVASLPISAISVYAEEAFTTEGMAGRW